MNYQAHYDRLVERAKNRILTGYVERHHATPRCMGGTDDKSNIVSLTAREHFVAHQLFVKIYPKNCGLIAAVNYFNVRKKNGVVVQYTKTTSRIYEWLRVRHAKQMSINNKGKKMTPEQIAKAAASHVGKKRSDEAKANMSRGAKARKISDEGRAALRAAKLLEAQKRKAAGIPHHNAGRIQTEEEKLKKSLALKGHKQSPEQIAKRTAARNATYAAKRMVECS